MQNRLVIPKLIRRQANGRNAPGNPALSDPHVAGRKLLPGRGQIETPSVYLVAKLRNKRRRMHAY